MKFLLSLIVSSVLFMQPVMTCAQFGGKAGIGGNAGTGGGASSTFGCPSGSGSCFDNFVGTSATSLPSHWSTWTNVDSTFWPCTLALTGSGTAQATVASSGAGCILSASSSNTFQAVIEGESGGTNTDKKICVNASLSPQHNGYCTDWSYPSGGYWSGAYIDKDLSGGIAYIACGATQCPIATSFTAKIVNVSGTISLYVNGAFVGSVTDTGTLITGGSPALEVTSSSNLADSAYGPVQDY